MSTPLDLYDLEERNGVLLVTFREASLSARGDLDLMFEHFARLVEGQTKPHLILDFRNVGNISSVFMGKLLALHRTIIESNGRLELIQVNDWVYQVFVVTRVHEYLKVFKAAQEFKPPPDERARSVSSHEAVWWIFCVVMCVSAIVGVFLLIRASAAAPTEIGLFANPARTWAACFFLAAIPGAIAVFLTHQWLRYASMFLQWALMLALLTLAGFSATILLEVM